MEIVYLNDWRSTGKEGMMSDFGVSEATLEGAEILVASYTYEDYSGSAFVLLQRGDKLYEVHGGHCSCYGLEGQWEEEETNTQALRHRLDNGWYGFAYADEIVRQIIDKLEEQK